ncbi:MAG TPA: beta-ketoacyl synthase chain length factor [Alphaproteobacteria bacterium]|nr:beta-ketoacyl synthase chain length factor [Alphaproteobacteria bacterium]
MQVSSCFWKLGKETGSWPKIELNPKPLPPMLQRRLTPLGQRALEMLYNCSSLPNSEQIPWVVSCRHGDMHRMVNLLSSLAKNEPLSPVDFSLSVHNAIIGAFSILTKNKKPHTALSGAELSLEMGLLEAFALQKEKKGTVGYIYYDMPLPQQYKGKIKNDCSEVCLAFLLSDKECLELSSEVLYLSYETTEANMLTKKSCDFYCLLEFLKDDTEKYELRVPGGYLLLQRVCK